MRGEHFLVVTAAAAALLCSARRARADAFTVWGFGPSGVAAAGARAASADDGTATAVNPGGLALGRGYRVEAGAMMAASRLEAAGQRAALEDPFGTTLALDVDVPLKGALEGRLRAALGVYALPTRLLHVVVRGEQAPSLPYYENRTQRLVVLPALSVRLARWLGVGVSLNTLAGLEGTADVRSGASRAAEPRIDQRAPTLVRPIVGVRIDPASWLRVGLVYRARFDVSFDVSTLADVGGVPLSVDVRQRQALFDPAQLTAAIAVDVGATTSLELDGSYLGWGAYDGPLLDVRATLPGVLAATPEHPLSFRDTFNVKASAAHVLPAGNHAVTLRAGAGYERSMMGGARQGATNLVDADKILLGVGATLALAGVLPSSPLRVGLGLGLHVLPTRTFPAKIACQAAPCTADSVVGPDAQAPGAGIVDPGFPTLRGGGVAGVAALSLGSDL
jgi:hypothetical protein